MNCEAAVISRSSCFKRRNPTAACNKTCRERQLTNSSHSTLSTFCSASHQRITHAAATHQRCARNEVIDKAKETCCKLQLPPMVSTQPDVERKQTTTARCPLTNAGPMMPHISGSQWDVFHQPMILHFKLNRFLIYKTFCQMLIYVDLSKWQIMAS